MFFHDTKDYTYIQKSDIGVLNITIKKDSIINTLEDCLLKGIELFSEFDHKIKTTVLGEKAFLFARTTSYLNPNVITRKYGLWGNKELLWLENNEKKTNSFERCDYKGKYFAGISELDSKHYFNAFNHSRTSSRSLILYSNKLMIDESSQIFFDTIFDCKTGFINWGKAINILCNNGNILIKVDGNFDDEAISIDLFLTDEFYKSLKNC